MIRTLILVGLLLVCSESESQDTLTLVQFESLVDFHSKKMKLILELKDSLTVDESIILVKIENTFHTSMENVIGLKRYNAHKQRYIHFDSSFVLHFREKVIEKLEASITYGFGYYSEKYGILVGGHLTDPKSYYYVKK